MQKTIYLSIKKQNKNNIQKKKNLKQKSPKNNNKKTPTLFYSVLVSGVLLSFYPKVLFPHICIYQPF